MKNKQVAPSLRFKKANGEDYPPWEQRAFGNIAIRLSSLSNKSDLPRVEYADIISGEGRLNKDIYAKERVKPGVEFKRGQVLYGKLRPYLQNWLLPTFSGIAVGDFWVLEPKKLDSQFLYYLIQAPTFSSISNLSVGTKMPRADWKLISQASFRVPSFSEEQQKIGRFLSDLDSLITLHQRKVESVKKLKKSLLQKMFPKEGETVPAIRFPGFTDAWEQRKLGEYACKIQRTYEESSAPIMMITSEGGFIEQSRRYSFNNAGKSLKKYILLYKGELAYNHGASKLRPYGSCFSLEHQESARVPYVYHCFSVSGHNAVFFSYLLNLSSIQKELRKLVSSGTRQDGLLNISFEQYCSVPIKVPTKEEQQKIATLFQELERDITLHQRKVETLKKLKKALLQRMFI